jgi:hypothetical protein
MTQHHPIPFLPIAFEAGADARVETTRLGTELLNLIKNITESPQAIQIAIAG